MFQVISGRDGTLDYKLHMYTKFYNLVRFFLSVQDLWVTHNFNQQTLG